MLCHTEQISSDCNEAEHARHARTRTVILKEWIMNEQGLLAKSTAARRVKEKKKWGKKTMREILRWLAPSTILRWWRRDGIRRNCGGEERDWPPTAVVAVTAAAPLSRKYLLLLPPPVVMVIVAALVSGPDIWTSRKKAKCCEQHLYRDLQAPFDGVSNPYVLSSF